MPWLLGREAGRVGDEVLLRFTQAGLYPRQWDVRIWNDGPMREKIRSLTHRVGFEINRFPPTYQYRRTGDLLRRLSIEVVIDVGANEGQYAAGIRGPGGYAGRIVSLEPGSQAFARLQAAAADDPEWDCQRLALMDQDGEMTLNIAAGDDLSSFRPSSPIGDANLPIATVDREIVRTARLDGIFDTLTGGGRTFVKIDVQGAESAALDGATGCLSRIIGLSIELPFLPVYAGEPPAAATIGRLHDVGFQLVGAAPLFYDETLGLNLEFDAIFLRHDALAEMVARRAGG